MTKFSFSKREKKMAGVVVLVIFFSVVYRGVYVPLKNQVEFLNNKISVAEQRLSKTLKIIRRAKIAAKKYDDILDDFKQTVSDEQVMSSILSEIETVAGELKMRIADMKPKKVKRVDFYNNFSVSLSIDGQLSEIMLFIYRLQNSPHVFYIEELRLNKSSPRKVDLSCQVVLSRLLILEKN